MEPIKPEGGHWTFNGKNKKGESKFQWRPMQELKHVLDVMESNDCHSIEVIETATRIDFTHNHRRLCYYWTSGRWGPFSASKTHYRSFGIEDLVFRFLTN